MISKTLKTLSGPVKIKIPENLNDITIGQMIAMGKLEEGDNSIPLIPDLTQEVADNICDYNQLIEIRERVLSIAHQLKYCYTETKIPEYISFGTKKVKILGLYCIEKENRVKVLKNLSIEPAGAYLASRDLIAEEINNHIAVYGDEEWKDNFVPSLDCCANLLAHYFYCPATGNNWQEQKAEAFKEEVLKLSIQDALPIARYFFLNYPNLLKQKISLYQGMRQKWKRKLALYRLKNSAT